MMTPQLLSADLKCFQLWGVLQEAEGGGPQKRKQVYNPGQNVQLLCDNTAMTTAISYVSSDTSHLMPLNILNLSHTIWKELSTFKGRKICVIRTYLHARLQ